MQSYIFFLGNGQSFTDLDASWRSDTAATMSPSGNNSIQGSYELMNSLLRTNENLSMELGKKNATIERLESSLDSLQRELRELKNRVADQTKTPKINRQLSATVKQVYSSLADNERFKLTEHFMSPHNISTKQNIMRILKEDNTSYTDRELSDHIRTKYTNDRRRDKELANHSSTASKKRKMNARRHSAFNSRIAVAQRKNMHIETIKSLTPYDMSDHESDGDDHFIVKKPTWRSEEIEHALQQLDSFAPLVRKRVVGSPSKREAL